MNNQKYWEQIQYETAYIQSLDERYKRMSEQTCQTPKLKKESNHD